MVKCFAMATVFYYNQDFAWNLKKIELLIAWFTERNNCDYILGSCKPS